MATSARVENQFSNTSAGERGNGSDVAAAPLSRHPGSEDRFDPRSCVRTSRGSVEVEPRPLIPVPTAVPDGRDLAVGDRLERLLQQLSAIYDRIERFGEQLDRVERRIGGEAVQEERWWTPAEVAQRVGRAALTVREWARLGKIPSKTDGRGRRWISDEVAQLIFRYQGLPPEEELSSLSKP
jgi:hypothetical protein